jgi:hypothetical protein
MKNNVEEIWDAIKELIPPLFMIISRLIIIILRFLLVIFPIQQIWVASLVAYYTKNELPGFEASGRVPGYFFRKVIENAIEKEKMEEASENGEGENDNT